MLGIDGYTVKWGADTRDFDRASRHVRDQSGRDAREFESHWSRAAKHASDKFIGFRNAGDAVKVGIAGVTGAVATLTKGLQGLGNRAEEIGSKFESVKDSLSGIAENLAGDVGGASALDAFEGFLDEFKEFQSLNRDYFQGAGTTAMLEGAVRDRASQTAAFALAKSEGDRLVGSRNQLSRAQLERQAKDDMSARQQLYELERKDAEDKFAKEETLARGDARRIAFAKEILALEIDAADARFNADVQSLNAVSDEAREKDSEAQKRQQEADELAKKKQFDEQARSSARIAEANDFLEITKRTAEIDTLRSRGMKEQAEAAQIRLDAERDVAEVMEKEDADLVARLDAADAILAARDAALGALGIRPAERRQDISTFLGPGTSGARGELRGQVLGGPDASFGRTVNIQEQQLSALQEIARNTSQTQLGVLGP